MTNQNLITIAAAAAMASHFAAELEHRGVAGAAQLETLVFLTIGVTVCVQGGWVNPLARWLDVDAKHPTGMILVGVNSWSLVLAEEMRWREILLPQPGSVTSP